MHNIIFFLLSFLPWSFAGTTLLGAGGGGGGSGMPRGLSFELDTMDKRKTRVVGTGLNVDLDVVEVVTSGGTLRYTPTHTEFEIGQSRWITTMTSSKMSFHHNDKAVIQLYAPEDSAYYHLSVQGNGGFRDVILDRNLGLPIVVNLCIIEKTLTDVESSSLTDYLNTCKSSMGGTHQSVQQTMEWVSKLLMKSASMQQAASAEIATTLDASLVESRKNADGVMSQVQGHWNQQFAEEKEKQAIQHASVVEELERQNEVLSSTPDSFHSHLTELNTTLVAFIEYYAEESELSLLSLNYTLEVQWNRLSDYYFNLNQELAEQTAASMIQLNNSVENSAARLALLVDNVTVVFSEINSTLLSKLNAVGKSLDDTYYALIAGDEKLRKYVNQSMDELKDVIDLDKVALQQSLEIQNSSHFDWIEQVNLTIDASLSSSRNEITDRLSLLSNMTDERMDILRMDLNVTKVNMVEADSILDDRLSTSTIQWNETLDLHAMKWNESLSYVNASLRQSLENNRALLVSTLVDLREESFLNHTAQDQHFSKEHHNLWTSLNTTIDESIAANSSVTEELKLLRANFSDQLEMMQSNQQTDNTATLLILSLVNHTLTQWYLNSSVQIGQVQALSSNRFEEIHNYSVEDQKIAKERWEQNTIALEMLNNSLILGLEDNQELMLNGNQQWVESLQLMNKTEEDRWIELNRTLRDLLEVAGDKMLQDIQEFASNWTTDVLALNDSWALEVERLASNVSDYISVSNAQMADLTALVQAEVTTTREHLEMLTNASELHAESINALSVNVPMLESALLDSSNVLIGNITDVKSVIMDLVQGNHGSLTKDLESVDDRLKDLDELVHGSVRSAWIELNNSNQIAGEKIAHISDGVTALEASVAQFEDRTFHMNSNISSIETRLALISTEYFNQTLPIIRQLEDQQVNDSKLFTQQHLEIVQLEENMLSQTNLANIFGDMSVSLLKDTALQIRHVEEVAAAADVIAHNVSTILLTISKRVDGLTGTSQAALELESKLNDDRFDELSMTQKNILKSSQDAVVEAKSLTVLYKELQYKTNAINNINSTLMALNREYSRRMKQAEDRELESSLATKELQQKLVVLEANSLQKEKQIEALMQEKDNMRKEMASQDSVDSLRKLLVELQTSMVQQSSKVLEVVISSAQAKV